MAFVRGADMSLPNQGSDVAESPPCVVNILFDLFFSVSLPVSVYFILLYLTIHVSVAAFLSLLLLISLSCLLRLPLPKVHTKPI